MDRVIVGIDPGASTGFAIFCEALKKGGGKQLEIAA